MNKNLNFLNFKRLSRKLRMCLFFMLSMFLSTLINTVQAQTTVTYTAAGGPYTLNIPEGLQIKIEAWGGGGGGGTGYASQYFTGTGGGGGAGGYVVKNFSTTGITDIFITVGSGGKGGNFGSGASECEKGIEGEDSLFDIDGSTSTATGGKGGGCGVATNTFSQTGTPGVGGTHINGDAGSADGEDGDGSAGGSSPNGGTGAPATTGNNAGGSGNAPGGGGGGGRMDPAMTPEGRNGGAGGTGGVRLTITCLTPVITSTSTLICGSSVITLSVNSPVTTTGVTYIWYKDGIATTTTGATYPATAAGTYTVKAEYKITADDGSPTFSPALSGDAIVSDASNEIILTDGPEVILNPYMGTFCSGETVVIDPKETTYGNTIPAGTTFEWTVASNTGVTIPAASGSGSNISFGQLINTTNAKQTVVYNVIPSCGGCSGDPVTLTINVNPDISVYLYSNFDSYCDGSNATLTAAALPDDTYEYEWYLDNVLVPLETGKTLTSALTARATPYMYYVIAKSTTCTGSKSNEIFIKVNNKPVVNITLDHTDIAVGGIINATASVMPAGDYDYVWYLDGLPKGYEKELILNDLSLGSHNIQVTAEPVKESNGCLAESSVVAITIHDKPYIELSPNSQTICIGGTATVLASFDPLTPIPPEIDGKYTYEWILGGKLIKGAIYESYTHKFDDSGTYEFKARLLIDNGNEKTVITDWSSTAIVVVLPEIKVTLFPDKDIYCEGDAVTITVRTEPDVSGDARYEYHWLIDGKLAGTTIENATTFTGILSREAPYKVSVIVEHKAEGCRSESNEVSFTVKEVPQVAITVDYTEIIVGGKITAFANVAPSDGSYDFIWYLDGEMVGYQQELILDKLSVGRYDLTVTATPTTGKDGCKAFSAPVTITVYEKPGITLRSDMTICIGQTADLTIDFQKEDDAIYSFQWELNGVLIPGATSDSYSPTFYEAGEYKVRVRMEINYGQTVLTEWSNYVTITVQEIPNVMLVGDNGKYCVGSSVMLIANTTPAGDYEYDWYLDNEFLETTTDNFYISTGLPSRATPYTYHVVARSLPGGCEGISNNFTIEVDALPFLIITTDYDDIGVGGSITATANVLPSGEYDYTWYLDGYAKGYEKTLVLNNLSVGKHNIQVTAKPVEDENGCSLISSIITVKVHEKPYVLIGATSKTICAGDIAELYSNVVIDGDVDGERTYEWTVNGVIIPGAIMNFLRQTLNEPGTYVYNLRVEVDYGQTFKSEWTSNSITITVQELPTVLLVGDDNSYCYGSSVQLTAEATPTGQYVYDWYLDNKFIKTTSGNTYLSKDLPARATPYTYYVIARSVPGGCEGISNEFSITVRPAPTVTVITNYTDICPGGSVTATAKVLPSGEYNYVWYCDKSVVGFEHEVTISNLTTGKHQIYVQVTNAADYDGCTVTSSSVTITVHSNPVVTIVADKDLICAGEMAVIRTTKIILDNVVRKENNFTYEWAVNGIIIPNASQSTYSQVLTMPGRYEYTMRMIQNNDFGCASDWSAPAVVIVEAIPQVSLMVENSTYCAGSSTLLRAAVIPAGDYEYDWYRDDVLILKDGGNTYTSSEPARVTAYNYHVVVHTAIGCESVSNKVSVNVKTAPAVTVVTNYTEICPGGSITATANVLPAGDYNYTWYIDDAVAGFSREMIIKNLSPGSYEVYVEVSSVSNYNGCSTSSRPFSITVHNNPVVTIAADNTLICGRGPVMLSVTDVELNSAVKDDSHFTYQWAVNGSIINGAERNTYTQMLEAGVYEFTARVVQNNNFGCASDWSKPVTVVVMSIEVPAFFITDCEEKNIGSYHIVHVPVKVNTGNPQNYMINFADVTQRSLNISGRIQNNYMMEIHLPLQAGDYEMEIRIDGCSYTSTGRVMVDTYALGGAKLIESRWNDVLIVNNNPGTNGGFTFYSYQWYKNGVLIPGANKQVYTEPDGILNGEYHVELNGYAKLSNGNSVEVSYVSCPFKPSAKFNITVYPVPVKQNEPLSLDTSLSEEELKGATLEIFNTIGMLQKKITNLSPQMSIPGFSTSDVYFGRLITLNNGIYNFRFIVAQ